MRPGYEREIVRILRKVGDRGISVAALAKHVYNMRVSLFSQPDPAQIHRSVQPYVLRESSKPAGVVERVRHGYYRLNRRSKVARQLLLTFIEEEKQEQEPPAPAPAPDYSLNLFGELWS